MTVSLDLLRDLSLDREIAGSEPLSLLSSPRECPQFAGAQVECLEFSCRGDRVPCTLVTPPGEPPFPIVLLQREPSDSAELRSAPKWARSWVEGGCAIVSIDLPLQGARLSPKLTQLLADARESARSHEPIADTARILWYEFTRQATLELRRTLDLIAALPTIDAERIGYAGFGLGAFVGAILGAVDDRPAAIVLAGLAAGVAPAEIAPESFVGRIGPRPLLFIREESSPSEAGVGAEALEKLHAAAVGEESRVESCDPGQGLDIAWAFLSQRLGAERSAAGTQGPASRNG